jgi:pimeloyl-ACP methyl ester carboxylesterase
VVAVLVAACSDHRSPLAATGGSASSSGGPGSGAPGSGSSGAGGPFVPAPLAWRSCGGRLKCASLVVPLDYSNPSGPTITLALDDVPARKPDQRIGSLLVNPGGPGGSGLDFASGIELPPEVLDRFDIIGFDPRGVGQSTPVQCGDQTVPAFRQVDSDPENASEQTDLDNAAKTVADDCGQHAGDLLAHLGTDDVARDVDTIRLALGEQQISYYGASYGTLIGLRYLALFPQGARAVVLDGVVDPTQDFEAFLRQQTIAFDAQLNAVFDGCATGSACPPGGARAAYDQVASNVETQPIKTRNGEALGPSELPVAALIPTYDPTTASIFYQGLKDALNGDGTTLVTLFQEYEQSADYAVYAGVECTDSPHPVGPDAYKAFADQLIALSPRLGGAIANELLPCAFWPAPVHDITGPVTGVGGPPVLVVGNTGDAATPYQQAVDVAKTLVNGRLVTFDATGHTALGRSQCVADAEAKYFVDLTLPPDGTVCSQ